MEHSVHFDVPTDPESSLITSPKPVSLADRLLRIQVVSSYGEAFFLIAVLVALLIGGGLYFLVAAVPDELSTFVQNR